MTSIVLGNFYFDYYSNRFGLGFRLGFELGLELGLGLRLVHWVGFFSLNYKMSARTRRAPSLFQKNVYVNSYSTVGNGKISAITKTIKELRKLVHYLVLVFPLIGLACMKAYFLILLFTTR